MAIDQTGMYILDVYLNKNNIKCSLPSLIVKMTTDQILTTNTLSQEPNIVLTFEGVYSAYTNDQLNEFEAMIFNCMLRQNGLLIQRSIALYAGSIIASMCTSGTTQQYASLTNGLTNSGNFSLNGISLSGAQIQGQTFSFASGETTTDISTTTDILTTTDIPTTTGITTKTTATTTSSNVNRSQFKSQFKTSYFTICIIIMMIIF